LTGVELSYSVEGPALADEPGRAVVYLASLGRPVGDLELLSDTAKSHGWTSVKVELPGVSPSPLPLPGCNLLGCGGRFPGDDEARAALRRCFDVTASREEHLRDVATAFFAPGNDPAVWSDGWHPEAAEAQAAAVAATPTEDWWLPPEPIRVLALVGAEDRIAPPANAAALVDALGERGRLVVLHGAGHALIPEQGPRVAAEFAEFLADRR